MGPAQKGMIVVGLIGVVGLMLGVGFHLGQRSTHVQMVKLQKKDTTITPHASSMTDEVRDHITCLEPPGGLQQGDEEHCFWDIFKCEDWRSAHVDRAGRPIGRCVSHYFPGR